MKTKLLSMARDQWTSSYADPALNRRNQLAWARAEINLGDRWVLAKSWTFDDIQFERMNKLTCTKTKCIWRRP